MANFTKRSVLNLYDDQSRAELFQTVVKPTQVIVTTNHAYDLYSKQVNLHNSDGTVVSDVAKYIIDLETKESDNSTKIDNEIQRATQADADLQDQIDVEKATRVAEVDKLLSDIQTESARAQDAEEANTNSIADLQTRVDTEKSRIDNILEGSTLDLDQLKELVDAYTNADTNILTTITLLSNSLTQLTADFNALKLVVDTLTTSS